MDMELVETFLNVAEYHSLSAAARQMFTTQSTISKRLLQLEEELGVPLFIRQKGQRTVELTSYGQHFIPLAQQWISLYRDCQNIRHGNSRTHLTVGANTLINIFTLVPFYQQYTDTHPEVCLFIDNHHSSELYSLLDRRSIDIGYVLTSRNYPDIIQTPLYQESMCLVCHKDSSYSQTVALSDLDPAEEVFLRWDTDFDLWHEQNWPGRHYRMRVATGSMVANYLTRPGRWSIVSASSTRSLTENHPLRVCTLAAATPKRTCYQLEHRYPRPSRIAVIDQWKSQVQGFIRENADALGIEPLIPC